MRHGLLSAPPGASDTSWRIMKPMHRLIAAFAIVVAFIAGRETATEVQARPIVTVKREVVSVPAHCPTPVPSPTDDVVEEDDPGGVEIADTEALRLLDADAKHRAALEKNLGARGALFGRVRDANTGELLIGVTIVATARGREQVAITDETGYFEIANLDPDSYTLTFYYLDRTFERRGVAVASRESTPIDMQLDEAAPRGELGIVDDSYVTTVPAHAFEGVLGDDGISISSGATVDNYVVEE